MTPLTSQRLLDLARIAAIIACVGILYSPSVATIGLVVTYAAFWQAGRLFPEQSPRSRGRWCIGAWRF